MATVYRIGDISPYSGRPITTNEELNVVNSPLVDEPIPFLPVVEVGLPPDMPPVDLMIQPVVSRDTSIPIPGLGEPPTCPPEITHCQAVITAVSELTSEISLAVLENITNNISVSIQPVVDAQNVVIGQLTRALDACERNLGTCHDRVMRPIQQGLGEVYGYMSQCGCPYPTPEQVVTGLQTGNCMASVGLCPPTYPTPSPPVQPTPVPTPECPVPIPTCDAGDITNYGSQTVVTNIYNQAVQIPVVPTPQQVINWPIPPSEVTVENVINLTREQLEQMLLLTITMVGPPPPPPPPEPQAPPSAKADKFKFSKNPAKPGIVPDWQHPKVCEALELNKQKNTAGELTKFVITPDGKRTAPEWFWSIFPPEDGKDGGLVWRRIGEASWTLLHGLTDVLDDLREEAIDIFRCDNIPLDSIIAKVVVGFVNHFTGGALNGFVKGFDYKLNQACPQEIPSQADIDAAVLSNQMSDEQWECLTKANNNLPELAKQVLASKRTRISFADALKLYRLGDALGEPMSGEDLIQWAGDAGVVTSADLKMMEKAAVDIPSVSDLIRMMVRDVADPAIVEQYNLDDEFAKKWAGKLSQMGDAQGISPEIAKLHWRAHWEYPSTFQSFDMMHRLRKDSPFAQRLDKESQARHAAAGTKSPGIFTDAADIQKLLEVNDMAWFWRERMAAISYRPLTRTDAQRAFQIGKLTEDELYGVYQDEGYAPETAKILVEFTKKQVAERKARQSLPRGVSKYVKFYLDGIRTQQQLEDDLEFLKVPADRIAEIVKNAFDERKIIEFKNAIACIRSSYMMGALDDVQATQGVINEGMDVALAADTIGNWWCKKKAKMRIITAAKLCEWREKKLINAEQHLRRLRNLGYSVEDADKIVAECEIDISERAYKKVVAQLKKQQVATDKSMKQAEKREAAAARAAKAAAKKGA